MYVIFTRQIFHSSGDLETKFLQYNKYGRKNKVSVILKTGRFDSIDSAAVIISSMFCTALLTLLMITAESMLSKRKALKLLGLYFFVLMNRICNC